MSWTKCAPLFMRIMYGGNIIVAGVVGGMSAFAPEFAAKNMFGGGFSLSIYIVGCLWLGIVLLSIFGLIWPYRFSVVFILQIFYKGLFLLCGAIPQLAKNDLNQRGQIGITVFFLVWVILLPFVVPWKVIFRREDSLPRSESQVIPQEDSKKQPLS